MSTLAYLEVCVLGRSEGLGPAGTLGWAQQCRRQVSPGVPGSIPNVSVPVTHAPPRPSLLLFALVWPPDTIHPSQKFKATHSLP